MPLQLQTPWTPDLPPAHQTAVETCHEIGYALIQGFYDETALTHLRGQIDHLLHHPKAYPGVYYYVNSQREPDGGRLIWRAERVWEALPFLADGPAGQTLIDIAGAYFGCEAILFKEKLNIRHPGSAGYAPHQDIAVGWHRVGERFLSIALFVNDTGPETGGFEFTDRAHRLGRLSQDGAWDMALDEFMKLDPHPVNARAGDVLLADAETPHRTVDNVSDTHSLHLLLTFAPKTDADIRAGYYAQQVEELGGRTGNIFTDQDFTQAVIRKESVNAG